jgi:hypothetical protein
LCSFAIFSPSWYIVPQKNPATLLDICHVRNMKMALTHGRNFFANFFRFANKETRKQLSIRVSRLHLSQPLPVHEQNFGSINSAK